MLLLLLLLACEELFEIDTSEVNVTYLRGGVMRVEDAEKGIVCYRTTGKSGGICCMPDPSTKTQQ